MAKIHLEFDGSSDVFVFKLRLIEIYRFEEVNMVKSIHTCGTVIFPNFNKE